MQLGSIKHLFLRRHRVGDSSDFVDRCKDYIACFQIEATTHPTPGNIPIDVDVGGHASAILSC
jgi:hypothetical protein